MGCSRRISAAVLAVAAAAVAARPAVAQDNGPDGASPPAAEPMTRLGPDASAPRNAVADVAGDIRRLDEALRNPATDAATREQAARRLVDRDTDAATAALRDVLATGTTVPARIAVARALADDPRPAESLIPTLAAALETATGATPADRALADAAAQALANYKASPMALDQLIRLATAADGAPALPLAQRASVVRALGRVPEPEAASALVGLLTPAAGGGGRVAPATPRDAAALRDAAGDALVELTGLEENGRDARRWRAWAANAPQDRGAWKAAVLASRAARFDRLQRGHASLVDEVRALLTAQYRGGGERKPALLLAYLNSGDPEVRLIGAQLVSESVANNEVSPAVRARLVEMVGDHAPEVRVEVARRLRDLNHEPALGPLLTQLAQERDAPARVAIAAALSRVGDVRAAPQLAALVDDPSPAVARAGADALRQVGRALRERDPALAAQVAGRLRARLQVTRGAAGLEDLRAALVDALAPLRDPEMLALGPQMLRNQQQEPAVVRQAVLRLLGEFGARADQVVLDVLRNERTEPTVRLAALEALGRTSGLEQAETLVRYMREGTDESIKDKARDVYVGLLAGGSLDQLNGEKLRFRDNERATRVLVLEEICRRLEQLGPPEADVLAQQRQSAGIDHLNLGRPDLAARHLRPALDHWLGKGADEATTEPIIGALMVAYLRAKDYRTAVTFGGTLVRRDPQLQDLVGPPIRDEASKLRQAGDDPAALQLIALALQMDPSLHARYQDDLLRIRRDIEDGPAADR